MAAAGTGADPIAVEVPILGYLGDRAAREGVVADYEAVVAEWLGEEVAADGEEQG